MLGYSYAFAFFMFGDMFKDHISKQQNQINQNLFEDQQQQLEMEVGRAVLVELLCPAALHHNSDDTALTTAGCYRWSGYPGWFRRTTQRARYARP